MGKARAAFNFHVEGTCFHWRSPSLAVLGSAAASVGAPKERLHLEGPGPQRRSLFPPRRGGG